MSRLIARMVLPLVVAAVGAAGCATKGTGAGVTPSGADPVTFTGKGSTASDSGTMRASLSDGTTYTGQYFQITRNTTVGGSGQCQMPDGKTIDATFPRT